MNKLLSLTAASALLSSSALFGQIEITDNLSVTGFIDMSSTYTDTDTSDTTTFGVDQVEIDFLLSFDSLTAEIDVEYTGDGIDLESAFITYDLGEGSSVTAGRFLSYLGWETIEPTGLYQYSFAYDIASIPAYHDGVSYDYSADWGSFGVALLDSVYNLDGLLSGAVGAPYEYGIEAKLVLTPAEGFTFFFGYGLDSADSNAMPGLNDSEIINFWASYEVDIHTFAFEYNMYETDGFQFGYSGGDLFWDLDADQYLLMYSAAVNDTGTFTARFSNESADVLTGMLPGRLETDKYTLAWIEAITDNLALVFEYSKSNRSVAVNGVALSETEVYNLGETDFVDSDTFAVEALFTF